MRRQTFLLWTPLIFLHFNGTASSKSDPECWFVFSDPAGQRNFNFTIDPEIPLSGIVTIKGKLRQDIDLHNPPFPSAFIDFLAPLNLEQVEFVIPLSIEVEVSTFGENTIRLKAGEKAFGSAPEFKITTSWIYDTSGIDFKVFDDNIIDIQILERNASTLDVYSYELYFGKPQDAEKYEFYYDSEKYGQSFAGHDLHSSTMVVQRDLQGIAALTSITVCKDSQPVLSDDSVEVIKAELDEAYTMTCKASGAPYLGSRWENGNGVVIESFQNETFEGAENVITSTLILANYSVNDTGPYSCIIFNKNFGNSAKKRFELHYLSLIAVPENSYNNQPKNLLWIVEGWPLQDVQLNCTSDSGVRVISNRIPLEEYFTLHINISLPLEADHNPTFLHCVLSNKTTILDSRKITFSGDDGNDCVPKATTIILMLVSSIASIIVTILFSIWMLPVKHCRRTGDTGSDRLKSVKDGIYFNKLNTSEKKLRGENERVPLDCLEADESGL